MKIEFTEREVRVLYNALLYWSYGKKPEELRLWDPDRDDIRGLYPFEDEYLESAMEQLNNALDPDEFAIKEVDLTKRQVKIIYGAMINWSAMVKPWELKKIWDPDRKEIRILYPDEKRFLKSLMIKVLQASGYDDD